MATFEELQKANESIITTPIKGKEYAEVNQRIKAFRMVYPGGPIITKMLSNEGGVCVFQATCYDEDGVPLATGHAYEKEGSSFINKTSYIENAETSSVGRCLGLAGFGIDTSVASADEVGNAIANQEGEKLITAAKAKRLGKMIENYGLSIETICDHYGHEKLEEFTANEYAHCLKKLEATKKEMEGKNE